jgi:hypothetical protein
MRTNALPQRDARDNPTGCCPRFDPAGWDGQHLNFAERDALLHGMTSRARRLEEPRRHVVPVQTPVLF